jgi:nitroimidazol reductase NimA-like FMN-containing flavoprotein (pyridoxamine 5'-phosphate oxidase superfamily)
MLVNEMTEKECRDLLARISIGRLGCSHDGQPYVVPVYFAYESDFFYVLSTIGQKIGWMRANPKVCIEIDEIASESEWVSVIVNGHYQEMPEPQFTDERARARKLLEKRYLWWQNALGERQLKSVKELITPTFFRIRVGSMTGLRAIAEGK